jgi:ribosome silencing factor RsfS/YbeB/iojap
MTIDERVERIVKELNRKKGEEIKVFNLDNVNYISNRVILVNSLSGKHSLALSKHLRETLKPLREEFLHVDESEDWVVLDMSDIIIHIMTPIYRRKYSLEEFLVKLSKNPNGFSQLDSSYY